MAPQKKQPQRQKKVKANAFQTAVLNTPQIKNCYQTGLRALGKHSKYVSASDVTKLQGSVDIDACLAGQKLYPQDNRWDYALGFDNTVHFIEVHSTHTGEVGTVENKLNWLKGWLLEKAPDLHKLSKKFHWIASGGNNKILPGSSQARRIAKAGLKPINKLVL